MALILKLLRELPKAQYLLIFTVIVFVLESLLQISSIYFQKNLINEVFINGDYQRFSLIILLIGGSAIAQVMFFLASPLISHYNQTIIERKLTSTLLQSIFKLPLALYHKERLGSYSQLFSHDISNIAVLLSMNVPRLVQLLISLSVFIYLYFNMNPVIMFVIVIVSMAQFWIGTKFAKQTNKRYEEVQQKRGDLLVHLEDSISGTREIIAYHRTKWETDIFKKLFEKLFSASINEWKVYNNGINANEAIKWVTIIGYFVYGCKMVIDGSLTIGEFVVLFQFTSMMMDSIQGVFNTSIELARNSASITILAEKFIHSDNEPSRAFREPLKRIVIQDVSFQYESQSDVLLRNLNIVLPIGNKIAFTGESGSGKSTLIQLLVRNYEPVRGKILVNGISLEEISESDWYNKVSIVFQDSYFFPDNIRNNLTMGSEVAEDDLIRVCKACCIHDFIMKLEYGYDSVIGERGITLSGGQRQRLAIARALLRNSELLILDEATSALDTETESKVIENIDCIRSQLTTISIAHRLSTISNSSVIFVLKNGEICESGTHEQLLSNNKEYKKLFTTGFSTNSEDKKKMGWEYDKL